MNRSGFVGVLAAIFIGLFAALAGYVGGKTVTDHQYKEVINEK